MPTEFRVGHYFLRVGVTGSCETPDVCAEDQNSGPLHEYFVLSAPQPFLQPRIQIYFLKVENDLQCLLAENKQNGWR